MKTSIWISVYLTLLVTSIQAQTCLSSGITFSTQSAIDSFKINYPDCTNIEGSVLINGSDITNLSGLDAVEEIGQDLNIIFNTNLTNLEGLNQLDIIKGILNIRGNDTLSSLSGLNNLDSINGVFAVSFNEQLVDFTGLDNLTSVGDFFISKNVTLTSLNGLNQLNHSGRDIIIEDNPSLNSIQRLENIVQAPGFLVIENNDALISLSGLEQLKSVGKTLAIIENDTLDNLNELTSLDSISSLIIAGNKSLVSIEGLTDVRSMVRAINIQDNAILTSLKGLDQMKIKPIDLDVVLLFNCPQLSDCAASSICTYLETGDAISIAQNLTGCNSRTEIETQCLVATNELSDEPANIEWKLFPNPTHGIFEIQGVHLSEWKVEIINLLGYSMIISNDNQIFDLSDFPKGIYILKLTRERQVLIKSIVLL